MSEKSKPCSHCGRGDAADFVRSLECVYCPDCGSKSPSLERWNTRPIEDALRQRIAERDRQFWTLYHFVMKVPEGSLTEEVLEVLNEVMEGKV